MNHSGAGHLKGMAVIIAGVFAVLLLLGRPVGEALGYAVVVACPLMMVMMMFGGHGAHQSRQQRDEEPAHGVHPARATTTDHRGHSDESGPSCH